MWVISTGPVTRWSATSERNSPDCAPGVSRSQSAANPKCENAPCSSAMLATVVPAGSAFVAAETSRAPKLWPARCSRSPGRAIAPSSGASPAAPTTAERSFIA